MSEELPENLAEVGNIHISIVMGESGLGTTFTVDSISREAAIGHLTIVLDRLRQAAAWTWNDPDHYCPNCDGDLDDEDLDDDGL